LSIIEQTRKVRGQALIELAIMLPVLILLLSITAPIIVRAIGSTWLDERLALKLFGQDDDQAHRLLVRTHDNARLPSYFQGDELEEKSQITPLGFPIPLLNHRFPGKIQRKSATVTLEKTGWWNRSVLGDPREEFLRLSRALSMVPAPNLDESRVPWEVRKLTLLGLAPGSNRILERAGLDLFHLNLDALPESASQELEK
jgi:hypothetical protein